MTDKPIVAVIACEREVEGERASVVKQRYIEAVAIYADAVPVIIPAIQDLEVTGLVMRVDSVLLTGSNSNIHPDQYGAHEGGTPPYDLVRDGIAQKVIAACRELDKPLFGICRGLQEINVAFGGTLVDERRTGPSAFSHHAADGVNLATMFGHHHRAHAMEGGLLAEIVGAEPFTVNSVHYQRIGQLGAGLRAEARSEDGVIEAISAPDESAPVLGVQWHPEWQAEQRPHDLAFWRYLGATARRYSRR